MVTHSFQFFLFYQIWACIKSKDHWRWRPSA